MQRYLKNWGPHLVVVSKRFSVQRCRSWECFVKKFIHKTTVTLPSWRSTCCWYYSLNCPLCCWVGENLSFTPKDSSLFSSCRVQMCVQLHLQESNTKGFPYLLEEVTLSEANAVVNNDIVRSKTSATFVWCTKSAISSKRFLIAKVVHDYQRKMLCC